MRKMRKASKRMNRWVVGVAAAAAAAAAGFQEDGMDRWARSMVQ
jgi:hypothetical protein